MSRQEDRNRRSPSFEQQEPESPPTLEGEPRVLVEEGVAQPTIGGALATLSGVARRVE